MNPLQPKVKPMTIALALLAHWPEGHAELMAILADDPKSETNVETKGT